MNLTRWTSTLGAGAVATIAAWSSWQHMVHVALSVGEHTQVAYVLPLSVDGLLVVAAAAMTDDKRNGRAPRWSARVAFSVGVAATIAANIASAQPTTGARVVAAWPAIALLLVVELLARSGRVRAAQAVSADATTTGPTLPAVTPEPAGRPQIPRVTESARKVARAAAKLPPDASPAQIAARAGVSESTVRRYLPAPPGPDRVDGHQVTPA